jgi:Raf kinase inhibitor-like YbhB/YbcL family protein
MPHRRLFGMAALSLAFTACAKSEKSAAVDTLAITTDSGPQSQHSRSDPKTMPFILTSPVFAPNGSIPSKYTCEGANVSPPLEWFGVHRDAKTLVLIMDDPDAPDPAKPQRVYVHWVVYNIPANITKLPENAAQTGLPSGAIQGINDWGKETYGGPCPPIGRHRYFFKIYALDTVLPQLFNPTKSQLEKAMEEHLVDSADVIGTYQKSKP